MGQPYDFNQEGATTSGGLANFSIDPEGQDFVITLGGFTNPTFGTAVEQSVDFMHELGHSLGLEHGGDLGVNCKPNYLSVMNYSVTYNGLVDAANTSRVTVDFSRDTLDTLVEKQGPAANQTGPDESAGVGAAPLDRPEGGTTVPITEWYDDTGTLRQGAAGPIPPDAPALDWNDDNDTNDEDPIDLNDDTTFQASSGNPSSCKSTDDGETLTGFNDWKHLNDNGLVQDDNAAQAPPVEMTYEQYQALRDARDQLLVPDASVALEAPRPGFHAASLGIAADDRHVYATHSYRTIAQPATQDRPSTLVVLDRATLRVKARIPLGFGARAVAVNQRTDRAYALSGSRTGTPGTSLITVIDTNTLIRVATIEFPTAQATADIAVNPRTNRVCVSNTAAGLVHVIDGSTHTVLGPAVPIGPEPVGLAVDPNTNTVYVAQSKRAPGQPPVTALGSFVDNGTTRPRVLPRTNLGNPAIQPVDVAVDPVGGRLYVAGLGASGPAGAAPSVSVVDLASRTFLTRLAVPGPVRAVAMDVSDRQLIAIGDRGVSLIDPTTTKIVRRIEIGLPFSVTAGAARDLFVGDFLTGQVHRRSYSSGAAVP